MPPHTLPQKRQPPQEENVRPRGCTRKAAHAQAAINGWLYSRKSATMLAVFVRVGSWWDHVCRRLPCPPEERNVPQKQASHSWVQPWAIRLTKDALTKDASKISFVQALGSCSKIKHPWAGWLPLFVHGTPCGVLSPKLDKVVQSWHASFRRFAFCSSPF